ncbi:MAG: Bug family tripartite tricarboxylate transporter substrate binding protein [Burkholderiales bacterium]
MRRALCAVAAVLGVAALPAMAAERYPVKPVRLVIPFAPGGTDIIGRVIAQAVSESLGQPVVIDNRPGAGGAIGAEITARAAPDGYTLNMTTSSYAASAASRKLPYDPVDGIQPIVLVGTLGLIMVVHPALPAKNVKELIAYAKAKPGQVSYGSVGAGSINHLALELFKLETGTNMVHVPYKGAGPALTAAIAGEIQLAPFGLVATLPHIKAGRLRALGITTPKRSRVLPDVPSIAETVPVFEVTHWIAMWGPKGLPGDIVRRWNSEVARVLRMEEIRARLTSEGLEPAGGPPEQLYQIIRRDVEKWRRVVREASLDLSSSS